MESSKVDNSYLYCLDCVPSPIVVLLTRLETKIKVKGGKYGFDDAGAI